MNNSFQLFLRERETSSIIAVLQFESHATCFIHHLSYEANIRKKASRCFPVSCQEKENWASLNVGISSLEISLENKYLNNN